LPISESLRARILDHLAFLYGVDRAVPLWKKLEAILCDFQDRNPGLAHTVGQRRLTERDTILITYGDQFQEPETPPLQTLYQVLTQSLDCPVSGIHILPFFPYSSDDGFSVIDYTQVDPALGDWADVERLGRNFRLMLDAVVNHISRKSDWFRCYVAGDPAYADWFIAIEPGTDLSKVARPRVHPLLTTVQTADGEKQVWTTFSEDQIDLNYAHPPVLLKIIEILLDYVERGAQLIRLDAIAYLWKTPGTPCIHLEETHRVVKLMRCVLDAAAPATILITETNVSHKENISYFGVPLPEAGSTDEAQMVYQFPLPPLVMHSILTGSARAISEWAAGLEKPAAQATFFNFTASHDGIGVMPARGLLSEREVQALVNASLAHGGQVSYKANPDGSTSVYELNISYFDALSDPTADEPLSVQVRRFCVSQAIMLALAGVPGIYVHSLIGSRGWNEGVVQTGQKRTINREKLDRAALERELADPESLRSRVFTAYRRLLDARAADPAFHPSGEQRVLMLNESVCTFLRVSLDGSSRVLCAHNVSEQMQELRFLPADLDLPVRTWRDLLTGEEYRADSGGVTLTLPPYAIRWWKT
jgi:sucrose phosphorylase